MKLDYNIVWIDDKSDTRPFQSMKQSVNKYVDEQFFNCSIQVFEDFDEFKDSFDDKLVYDLIITDLSLSNDTTGKQVIDFVRENKHNHTEIFFYSANKNIREINLVNFNRITFFQLSTENYRELENEIKDLIALTIQKFQHIVAMRGMIMHETSSLDSQMLDIIKIALKNKDVNFSELSVQIYDELNGLYNQKIDFVNECRTKSNFKELTKDNFVFSAEYKIKTLGQILNSLQKEDFSGKYKSEINSIRNKFAHAILEKDPNTGREYFKHGESGLTFDEELCKKIRKDINKHKTNFDNLQNELK